MAGNSGPAAAHVLSPAHLSELLVAAAAALECEREAKTATTGGGGGGGRNDKAGAAHDAASAAVHRLERACRVPGDIDAATAAAGRVPLLQPSAVVDAALDALARLIAAGSTPGHDTRATAHGALRAVHAVAYCSPLRVAALVQRGPIMRALAAALGARDGDAAFRGAALRAALQVISFISAPAVLAPARANRSARERGADLRALGVAVAGAFGALVTAGVALEECGLEASDFDGTACSALSAMIVALPPGAGRRTFCAAIAAQVGFGHALSLSLARLAAGVPPLPGAARSNGGAPWAGGLIMLAALASEGDINAQGDGTQGVHFCPALEQPAPPPSARALATRLLASAPALPERLADLFVAGAPWYGAVTAALAPGRGGSGAGAAAILTPLLAGCAFQWLWTLSALELLPAPALTAAGGGAVVARLAPALLQLAEAAQAAAAAPLSRAPPQLTDHWRDDLAVLAAVAARVVSGYAGQLGQGAAALLGEEPRSTLAALARLSALPPSLLAAAGDAAGARQREVARLIGPANCKLRARAAAALMAASRHGAAPQLAALLAAAPELAAALAAAVGLSASEQRFALLDPSAAALVVERRFCAASTLSVLAEHIADAGAGAGADASWLCRALT